MTSPIALYLPVFTPVLPPSLLLDEGPDMEDPTFLDDELASAGDDVGLRIAQARDEVLMEAAAATEAALAAQAAELESHHAGALAEARRRWVESEGEALAALLRTGLADVERLVAEGVAEILQPLLDRAVRAKAAEELREAVTNLLANGDGAVLRISGPADLVEPLRSAFPQQVGIEIAAADVPDVTVEAGDTTIRTQLRAWADTLATHVGEMR